MFKLNFSEDCTVHDLAIQIKAQACEQMGEAKFVQLLLFVNKLIGGEIEHILAVLTNNPIDSLNYQMALCWLDSNGFGYTRFAELEVGLRARIATQRTNKKYRFGDWSLPDSLN